MLFEKGIEFLFGWVFGISHNSMIEIFLVFYKNYCYTKSVKKDKEDVLIELDIYNVLFNDLGIIWVV
jgi:hypothetical protein